MKNIAYISNNRIEKLLIESIFEETDDKKSTESGDKSLHPCIGLLSAKGANFMMSMEGWYDQRAKGGCGKVGDAVAGCQSSIDAATTISLGPGLTNYADKSIVSGRHFSLQEIAKIYYNTISHLCSILEKDCPNVKNMGQTAIDATISLLYGAPGSAKKLASCTTPEELGEKIYECSPTHLHTGAANSALEARADAQRAIAQSNGGDIKSSPNGSRYIKNYCEPTELKEFISMCSSGGGSGSSSSESQSVNNSGTILPDQ